ncbi:unnamed protein product [Coffea canephora]|uniref:Uncharacterized protein n=1 Tax=Coffea canephora TaxID=49390 RepID=A0A068U2M4_COFCA|nr:unnamed protein product [Coffea canephora]
MIWSSYQITVTVTKRAEWFLPFISHWLGSLLKKKKISVLFPEILCFIRSATGLSITIMARRLDWLYVLYRNNNNINCS